MVNLNDYLSHETIKKYRNGKLDWETEQTLCYFEEFQGRKLDLSDVSQINFDFEYDYSLLNASETDYFGIGDKDQVYLILNLDKAVDQKRQDELVHIGKCSSCVEVNAYHENENVEKFFPKWSPLSGDYYNVGFFHTVPLDGKIFCCHVYTYIPDRFLECAWIYAVLHNDDDQYFPNRLWNVAKKQYPAKKVKKIAKNLSLLKSQRSSWIRALLEYFYKCVYSDDERNFKVSSEYTFKVVETKYANNVIIVDSSGKEHSLDFLENRILPEKIIYDMTIDMDTLYKLIVVILLECVPWYTQN